MPVLTEEDYAVLEKTPEGAAVAKKLKETNWVPDARFAEVNEKVNAAMKVIRDELLNEVKDEETRRLIEKLPDIKSIIDFKKKFIEKKMTDAGELNLLVENYKKELSEKEELLKQANRDADEYRKAMTAKRESVKKLIGDKWLPIYDQAPLDQLEKIEAMFKEDKQHPDGSHPGGQAPQINPWKKESLNLTKQVEITRKDPALAYRLKTEAGIV